MTEAIPVVAHHLDVQRRLQASQAMPHMRKNASVDPGPCTHVDLNAQAQEERTVGVDRDFLPQETLAFTILLKYEAFQAPRGSVRAPNWPRGMVTAKPPVRRKNAWRVTSHNV